MFTRISNSYHLVCQSWEVLKKDKEILLFPVLSGVLCLVISASFIVPLAMFGIQGESGEETIDTLFLPLIFLFYFATYFIAIFFNVGVMHCASIRMDGGDPTVGDGFKAAMSNLGSIFVWALISASVGMILRMISERAGILGKIIISLVGMGWNLLTFFVIPVLIFEKKGAFEAIKRSGNLFKKTWGETVAGEAGIGLFFGLLAILGLIPVFFGIYLASSGGAGLAFAIMIIGLAIAYWIVLGVVSAALSGIFSVALYRFATTGDVPDGFDQKIITNHWRRKRKR